MEMKQREVLVDKLSDQTWILSVLFVVGIGIMLIGIFGQLDIFFS
jgi:hypothetical protein